MGWWRTFEIPHGAVKARFQKIVDRAECPACRRPSGTWCVTSLGNPAKYPHAARSRKYEETVGQLPSLEIQTRGHVQR